MPFLDRLSYGEQVPADAEATRTEWRRTWNRNRWKERIARREKEERAKQKRQ